MKYKLNANDLDAAVGGAKQNNSNNNGQQMNNQEGDNYNEIIQQNNVEGNSGNVDIGSPIVVKGRENSVTNITLY